MKTPGYYVEGAPYGVKFSQAAARAKHLARTFGREVSVTLVSETGEESSRMVAQPEAVRQDWSPFMRACLADMAVSE